MIIGHVAQFILWYVWTLAILFIETSTEELGDHSGLIKNIDNIDPLSVKQLKLLYSYCA